MGKATTLIGITLFIGIIASLVALSIQSVDPTNDLLASNALFGSFNIPYTEMNTSGNTWTNNKDYTSTTHLPGREATGEPSASGSTQFPDWTYSGFRWLTTVMSIFLNVIGAPYTIAMMISPTSAGAVVGTGLGLLNLFIIVGWLLGKID